MYCPVCKIEYREGFYTCADCSVPLVVELPPNDEVNAHLPSQGPEYYTGNFVEVFRTDDFSEILLLKSALEDEGIPSNFNDFMLTSEPSLARLFVPTEFETRVRALLKDLQLFLPRGSLFPI